MPTSGSHVGRVLPIRGMEDREDAVVVQSLRRAWMGDGGQHEKDMEPDRLHVVESSMTFSYTRLEARGGSCHVHGEHVGHEEVRFRDGLGPYTNRTTWARLFVCLKCRSIFLPERSPR